jgi:hypothetical protein
VCDLYLLMYVELMKYVNLFQIHSASSNQVGFAFVCLSVPLSGFVCITMADPDIGYRYRGEKDNSNSIPQHP